jgi:hypothetical protein
MSGRPARPKFDADGSGDRTDSKLVQQKLVRLSISCYLTNFGAIGGGRTEGAPGLRIDLRRAAPRQVGTPKNGTPIYQVCASRPDFGQKLCRVPRGRRGSSHAAIGMMNHQVTGTKFRLCNLSCWCPWWLVVRHFAICSLQTTCAVPRGPSQNSRPSIAGGGGGSTTLWVSSLVKHLVKQSDPTHRFFALTPSQSAS